MSYQPLSLDSGQSAIYYPGDHLLVLAHGAGAGMDHRHMANIADALARVDIGTLRFNFPFIEAGRRRVDSQEVCLSVIADAVAKAADIAPGRILVGGHSFGGRMASHYLTGDTHDVRALVCFSFPLHMAKKPTVKRAAHLGEVNVPMLFLSGDRDALAERQLMEESLADLPRATLHWLHTADHSFKILKRTRTTDENVYDEAARVLWDWLSSEC